MPCLADDHDYQPTEQFLTYEAGDWDAPGDREKQVLYTRSVCTKCGAVVSGRAEPGDASMLAARVAGDGASNMADQPMTPPTDALLSCPFCGGTAAPRPDLAMGDHAILCAGCGAESSLEETRSKAIAAWNTRADLSSEVARLKGERDEARCGWDHVGEFLRRCEAEKKEADRRGWERCREAAKYIADDHADSACDCCQATKHDIGAMAYSPEKEKQG